VLTDRRLAVAGSTVLLSLGAAILGFRLASALLQRGLAMPHGFKGERTLMRIHIGERDKHKGKPLYQAIVELLLARPAHRH
jgi:hypothetical protein